MSASEKHFYEFDCFRLDPAQHVLLRDGQIVPLTPKVFETLLVLVENGGQVVDKDALLQKVWSDAFVEETNLTKNISILRKVLSENNSVGSFIETIPKRGYRFTAPVRKIEDESSEIAGQEKDDGETPGQLTKPRTAAKTKKLLTAAAVCFSALLAFAGYWLFSRESDDAKSAPPIKSIAILPFKSLNADDENYLGMGMTDALITRLGHLKSVIVRPTGAVRQYTDEPQIDAVAIGRALRVEAVLEGSVQRDGDRVRVTVQLINVGDGRQIWADKFEEKLIDFFAVQDAIAVRAANALTPQLTGEEQKKLVRRETNNPEAFQLYARGHFFANQETTEGFKKAVEHLNKAVELDPAYAPAYAALARAYHGASEWHLPPREAMPKVRIYAERALSLDETLAEGRVMLGYAKMLYEWDGAGAESDFKSAAQLNPNHSDARSAYSWFLALAGRHREAVAEAERVEKLNPLLYPCQAYYFARDYDRTIAHAKKNLDINPNNAPSLQWLGLAYAQQGRYEAAAAAFQKAREIDDTPDFRAYQARVYALAGKRSEAVKMLAELQEMSKQRYISPFFIAVVYAGLDEKDAAFEWLEKASEDRSFWMTSLKVNPQLDPLRDDPRFQELMKRVGFP